MLITLPRLPFDLDMIIAAALFSVTGCSEIPQDAVKPFAARERTQAYAGDPFKGDKSKYEKTLSERANYQNEYLRIEEKPK